MISKDTVKVSVYVSKTTYEALRKLSYELHKPQSEIIRAFIEKELGELSKTEGKKDD